MASTKIAGLAKPPNTSNNIRDKISMHDCLLVSEILSNILNTYDASTKAGTSSLLALATTCRIFQQPALDVLYRDLKSISTLIKCLPRDLWEEVGDSRKKLLVSIDMYMRLWLTRVDHSAFGGPLLPRIGAYF